MISLALLISSIAVSQIDSDASALQSLTPNPAVEENQAEAAEGENPEGVDEGANAEEANRAGAAGSENQGDTQTGAETLTNGTADKDGESEYADEAWYWYLVFWGALIGTLVASVMADEQEQRLKNGALGTIAGSAGGAVAALLAKQDALLFLGFLGSAFGALGGWAISLALSIWAAKGTLGKTVLEYQIGGWQAVKIRLELEREQNFLTALNNWSKNFSRAVDAQKEKLLELPKGNDANSVMELVITAWLGSVVNFLDRVFQLAKRKKYCVRVTIIVFGKKDENGQETIVGRHWIKNSGSLPAHKNRSFTDDSIAYKVLQGTELTSPHFANPGKQGEPKVVKRGGESQRYRKFMVIRLNDSAVVSLDWHADIEPEDPFLLAASELFELEVCPAVHDLLEHWDGSVQAELGLKPLIAPATPAP